MHADPIARTAYGWEPAYEKAISEPDPSLRRARLQEAEIRILERARMLELESRNDDAECLALEEAADFIREMKKKTQMDGIGKEVSPGDMQPFPNKPEA